MLPNVVLHNSISLDGSLTNFKVNINLHYEIARRYKPDGHLIGSNTIKIGIELYGNAPPEESNDFNKPDRTDNLPFWVIPDTKGILKDKLHEVRRFEFCKDVIVLISKETPRMYIKYLEERDYDFHVVDNKQVDLKKALEFISKNYSVKTMLTDTGKILGNLLLNQGLVKEISLLVHPIIVGGNGYSIFRDVKKNLKLELVKNEILNKDYIWLVYKAK
ncbi:MAG: dihydrofolate reductase family protein [Thermoplasmatales archaeon]|nr:MAG: dihydrofolate reductase family protein [Thermoplasmatales archaeon]